MKILALLATHGQISIWEVGERYNLYASVQHTGMEFQIKITSVF